VIQRLLGHATVGLALSIYTEVVEGQLERAVLEEDILA
jgi:site-specific recombinase XerD